MDGTKEKLIVTLAEKLAGAQADSQTVEECLSLVGNAFSFDCAAVYEINHLYRFALEEVWVGQGIVLRQEFAVEEMTAGYRSLLTQLPMVRIDGGQGHPEEEELLAFFSAGAVRGVSVTDAKLQIYGFILFLDHSVRQRTAQEENALSVLLPMLGRYVGVRMYRNKLAFAQTSLENVLDNTGIDIYVNDFYNHDILYVNRSMAAPYGGISQFEGKKCWAVLFPGQTGPCEFCPQKQLIDEQGHPTKVYTWDYQRAFDGSWFRVFSAAFRWMDGRLAHVVSSADITDNKRNEELIAYMANYDSLTGLPNRRMLVNDCERRIDQAEEGTSGYLLFFDIDGFKKINDSLGHEAGDEFLVQLGGFFMEIPMLKQGIYRNGGDEFVAVLDGNVTREQVQMLSGFIHERFKKPWKLKKGEVFCSTSIGVACYPEDGSTAEELLQKADQAMYRAKKAGGGSMSFGQEACRISS